VSFEAEQRRQLMGNLDIHLCPETGICSIIKNDGTKVDLMPGEVSDIRAAAGDTGTIGKAISEADSGFAEQLSTEDLSEIAGRLS